MTGIEDIKQKAKCLERYKKRDEECSHMSEFDIEREIECGICMEKNPKIALPDCNHAMCLTCYRDWCVLLYPQPTYKFEGQQLLKVDDNIQPKVDGS